MAWVLKGRIFEAPQKKFLGASLASARRMASRHLRDTLWLGGGRAAALPSPTTKKGHACCGRARYQVPQCQGRGDDEGSGR